MKSLILSMLAAIALTAAGTDAANAGEALDWQPCDGGLQCATVNVPVDHDNPAGDTIDIAIARIPAADPAARIGSLLINPGGPGGSGIEFVRGYADDPPAAWHENFDIVGFDPRGAGISQPIDCNDHPTTMTDLDPSPDTPEEEDELYAAAREFAADCERTYGAPLEFLDTKSAARDMEAIRIALGEEQLTYVGFSYGTFLGANYAGLFPDRVRAFVLDGALDPALEGEEWLIGQALGYEAGFDAFLADCEADTGCAFTPDEGSTLSDTFDRIMAGIEEAPMPTPDGDEVEVGIAWTGVTWGLYDSGNGWSLLRNALADAKVGNGAGLWNMAGFYNGREGDGYDNMLESYFAIICADMPYPRTEGAYATMAARVTNEAPRFGPWTTAGTNLPCTFWPFEARGEPAPIAAPGAAPIVVVGTTNDPATPYEWSQGLAEQLESGVLLTRVGEGHTAYNMGNTCIDSALDTYVVTLQPPADGTVCQADGTIAPPTPTSVAPTPTPETGVVAPETEDDDGGMDLPWAAIIGIGALIVAAIAFVVMRTRRDA